MSEPIVQLEGVSLCYRLAKQRVGSIKEYFIHLVRGSLSYHQLWALNDVDLTVGRGEVVGIVGRNGAGKSTLSKVIAGVLKPTRGSCRVGGTISPILELGTGFDWELTGFENIYLNAMLRGHRRRDVDSKIDEIIDFSGLREFIHSPVRNYSTGMMARLGFSVATAWPTDVLVLDEVLAVGDVRFLHRCHARIAALRAGGTTILLVSHNPREIMEHCSRCLWLDGGILKADGDPKGILGHYIEDAEKGVDLAPGAAASGAAEPAEAVEETAAV
ncbi:MAG: ABC transporter ATP-binding protein [Thermoanaerobaculia bacterium]